MPLRVIEHKEKTKRELYEENVRHICTSVLHEKKDPLLKANGQLRIERTLQLLEKYLHLEGCKVADLGCGILTIASLLAEKQCEIVAADAALHSIPCSHKSHISLVDECIPYLSFNDAAFDGVVFTDVIAEIEPHLYRLTLSEISRIVKKEGWLICSSEIDLYSADAHERFIELIKTEFEIIDFIKSHHRLHFYLDRFIKAPSRFVKGGRQAEYRLRQLQKRSGIFRLWFYLNSIKAISIVWRPLAFVIHPFQKMIEKKREFSLFCEKLSKCIWGDGAVTHLIVLAQKKKL